MYEWYISYMYSIHTHIYTHTHTHNKVYLIIMYIKHKTINKNKFYCKWTAENGGEKNKNDNGRRIKQYDALNWVSLCCLVFGVQYSCM